MQSYKVIFHFPPENGLNLILFFFVSFYILIIARKFFLGVKTGTTLLYLGSQPTMLFRIITGKLDKKKTERKFNVYGYSYLSPSKTVLYGLFFFLASLLIFLLAFAEIRAE